MRLVLVHAGFLLATLVVAYQTWTRDRDYPALPGSVILWSESPEDVSRVSYRGDTLRVVLEQLEDSLGRYLWGTVTRRAPSDASPEADEAAEGTPPAPGRPQVTSQQFLVGQYTEVLLESLARPRALRDLGTVAGEREHVYGITASSPTLEIEFARGTRVLLVGDTVFGTRDRYVKDPSSGALYVLAGTEVNNLETPEGALPERNPHAFAPERVASVTVRTERGERTMRRAESAALRRTTWTPVDAPDRPDQTFANFMDRLQQLWITEFAAEEDAANLESLVRVEYFAETGRGLGYLELLRAEGPQRSEYFVLTEHTRALTHIDPSLGEALDQDVSQLF